MALLATGVGSITFETTELAFSGGHVVGREFDILDSSAGRESEVLLGDCNLDGVVNFSDIPAMIDIVVSGVYREQADCNGVLDFSDINPFIAILIAS